MITIFENIDAISTIYFDAILPRDKEKIIEMISKKLRVLEKIIKIVF